MGQAISPITFSDETIAEIEKTLDLNLSSTRRELLKRILLEWGCTDLVEHLSREPRPVIKKRIDRLEQVKTDAHLGLSALEVEDLDGLVWRGTDVSKSEYKRQLERLVEASQYIADLGTIAPEVFWPLKGPRPPTITAYLVLQDAAAIFYWLTETMPTREVDRANGSEIGPFFRFRINFVVSSVRKRNYWVAIGHAKLGRMAKGVRREFRANHRLAPPYMGHFRARRAQTPHVTGTPIVPRLFAVARHEAGLPATFGQLTARLR